MAQEALREDRTWEKVRQPEATKREVAMKRKKEKFGREVSSAADSVQDISRSRVKVKVQYIVILFFVFIIKDINALENRTDNTDR